MVMRVRRKLTKLYNKCKTFYNNRVDHLVDKLFVNKLYRKVIWRFSRRKRYDYLAYALTQDTIRMRRLKDRPVSGNNQDTCYLPVKNQICNMRRPKSRVEKWRDEEEKKLGSRGIEQNLDVVAINTRIEKTSEQRAKERRQADIKAAAQRDAPNPESGKLREEINSLNQIILELRAELGASQGVAKSGMERVIALEKEVVDLKKELKRTVGSEKKLPDVIVDEDLKLENAPATARQLPKTGEKKDEGEE